MDLNQVMSLQREYRDLGISLEVLEVSRERRVLGGLHIQQSYQTMEWLLERDGQFQVIYFHEWRGVAYFTQVWQTVCCAAVNSHARQRDGGCLISLRMSPLNHNPTCYVWALSWPSSVGSGSPTP